MEAERDSLYKAIGYAKEEALQPFSKGVFAVLSIYSTCVVVIFSCVYTVLCTTFTYSPSFGGQTAQLTPIYYDNKDFFLHSTMQIY